MSGITYHYDPEPDRPPLLEPGATECYLVFHDGGREAQVFPATAIVDDEGNGFVVGKGREALTFHPVEADEADRNEP